MVSFIMGVVTLALGSSSVMLPCGVARGKHSYACIEALSMPRAPGEGVQPCNGQAAPCVPGQGRSSTRLHSQWCRSAWAASRWRKAAHR